MHETRAVRRGTTPGEVISMSLAEGEGTFAGTALVIEPARALVDAQAKTSPCSHPPGRRHQQLLKRSPTKSQRMIPYPVSSGGPRILRESSRRHVGHDATTGAPRWLPPRLPAVCATKQTWRSRARLAFLPAAVNTAFCSRGLTSGAFPAAAATSAQLGGGAGPNLEMRGVGCRFQAS